MKDKRVNTYEKDGLLYTTTTTIYNDAGCYYKLEETTGVPIVGKTVDEAIEKLNDQYIAIEKRLNEALENHNFELVIQDTKLLQNIWNNLNFYNTQTKG